MNFLDKYSSVGETKNSKPKDLATDKGYKKWKTDNAKTLIDGVHITEANIGIRTQRVLSKLDAKSVTPKKNQQLRIRTQAELNMIGLVIALLKNKIAENVIIISYSINKEALDTLCALVKAKTIKNLQIIMASSISYRDPKHKIYMGNMAKQVGFKLAFVYSHLKICLIKTECGKHYVSEGSMNFSRNNSAENLIVEESKEMYLLDKEFITKTMLSPGHKAVEVIT